MSDPFGGGGGGGGSTNPFGGGGSGGKAPTVNPFGGGKKPKPKNPKQQVRQQQQDQNKQLVHLASRLLNAQENQKAGAQQAIGQANAGFSGTSEPAPKLDKSVYNQSLPTIKAEIQKTFKGYTSDQVKQIAKQGGLLPKQVDTLVSAVKAQESSPGLAPWVFDIISRPGQAVLAGGAEGQNDPLKFDFGAAWRGLQGKTHYSPLQATAMANAGTVQGDIVGIPTDASTAKGAAKWEEQLPGWAKFAGNVAIGTATDPTTYVSFGTTAIEKAAARSAAADLALSRAAEALRVGEIGTAEYKGIRAAAEASRATGVVTNNPFIQRAAQDLATKGKKALTPELQATLPKALQKKIRSGVGGVKIAGRPIPGTNFYNTPERAAARLAKEDTAIALGRAKSGIEEATKPSAEIVRATQKAYKEAKKNGFDRAHVDARVAKALDVGNTPEDWARLTDTERALATKMREQYDTITKEQQDVGLLQTDQAALASKQAEVARPFDKKIRTAERQGNVAKADQLRAARDEAVRGAKIVSQDQYLARYATDQAKATLPKVSDIPWSPRGTGISAKTKARTQDWAQVPAQERKLADGTPFYEPNPSLSTIRRVGEAKRDVAHVESVNALRQIRTPEGTPMALTASDPGFKAALTDPNYATIDLPATAFNPATGAIERSAKTQVLVRKEIEHEVHRTFDLMTSAAENGPAWKKFSDGVNQVNRLWKGYATVFGPLGSGFVWRNMVGNFFNGFWLTGHLKTAVFDMTEAAKIQAKIHRAMKAGEDWGARLSPKEAKWVEEADKYRAIESGFFSHGADLRTSDSFTNTLAGPLAQMKNSPIKKTIGAPFNPDNPLLAKTGSMNSAIEDNARLALYIRLRKQGYTAQNATRVVHKYLFDYQTIDKFTEETKRLWNPFFTWTRKNIPLQFETLLKNPGRITSQMHLIEAAQSVNPLDVPSVPGYAQDKAPIGVAGSSGNQLAVLPDLPIMQAADATKAGVTLLSGLNQWRKTGQIPPNMMQDVFRDFYQGVGPGGIAGMAATGVQIASGQSAFTGAPIDSTTVKTPFYLGGGLPGVPDRIPKSLQSMLESVAPGLSKVRGVAPRDPKDKERWAARLASILGGQTVVPANDKSRLNNTYGQVELLNTLRKWLLSQGVTLPKGQYQSDASKNPFGG